MPKFTPWPYLIRFKPEEAKKRIEDAYRQGNGMKTRAALLLGVSERQLRRYCIALGIHLDEEQVRAEAKARRAKAKVSPPES